MIDSINILLSSAIAVASFSILSGMHNSNTRPHLKAALLFWGISFTFNAINYVLQKYTSIFSTYIWAGTAIDSLGTMSVILVAYCLHIGAQFSWSDKRIHAIFYATPAFVLAMLVLGLFVQRENVVWKLFYISPIALISSLSMVFLAIFSFKEKSFEMFKWPVLITLGTYAIIQMPGYVFMFVAPTSEEVRVAVAEGFKAIKIFVAAGKGILLFILAAFVLNTGSVTENTNRISAINLSLSLLSVGFLIFVFLYRVISALSL